MSDVSDQLLLALLDQHPPGTMPLHHVSDQMRVYDQRRDPRVLQKRGVPRIFLSFDKYVRRSGTVQLRRIRKIHSALRGDRGESEGQFQDFRVYPRQRSLEQLHDDDRQFGILHGTSTKIQLGRRDVRHFRSVD